MTYLDILMDVLSGLSEAAQGSDTYADHYMTAVLKIEYAMLVDKKPKEDILKFLETHYTTESINLFLTFYPSMINDERVKKLINWWGFDVGSEDYEECFGDKARQYILDVMLNNRWDELYG